MKNRFFSTDRILKFVFLISLAGISYGYGFMSHRENLFPQQIIHEAYLAATALKELNTEYDNASMPASFKSFDDEITSGPNVQTLEATEANNANDWILIVGGPYEYLEQCPNFGCLAWVTDRAGNVIHKWEVDLDSLWANADHVSGLTAARHFKPQHVELMPDGSIVVLFWNAFAFPTGAGMAKFDIDGNLLWIKKDNSHHWFTTDDAGRIYAPSHFVEKAPIPLGNTTRRMSCNEGVLLIDSIEVIDMDGTTIDKIPLYDILIENGYAGVIERTQDRCDALHLNFVEYVSADIASKIDGVEAGDLVVSMRNISTVALIDPAKRKVKWLINGLNIYQHSPRFLPDGTIVIFDNFGGDESLGGSRITRHRIFEDNYETIYPGQLPEGREFLSEYAGHITVHPEGDRLLVSLTEKGSIWEISRLTGKVNWIYDKVFPAKNYPGAESKQDAFIRVEAFGAYYVDKEKFAAARANSNR